MKEIVIISAWPDTEIKENLLINCIKHFKKLQKDILLISHYPISEYIVKEVTYCIYDKHNIIDINHSLYTGICDYWMENDSFRLEVCFPSHSSALSRIFGIALDFVKNLGYEYFTIIESDSEYDISDLIKLDSFKEEIINNNKKLFFFKLRPYEFSYWENQGIFEVYETICFGGIIDEFQSKLKFPKTLQDWTKLRTETNSIQNLEHVVTNCFKNHKEEYLILDSIRNTFTNSKINKITVSEPSGIYYNIIDPKHPILFLTNTRSEKKTYKIRSSHLTISDNIQLNGNQWIYFVLDLSNPDQEIEILIYKNDILLNKLFYIINKQLIDETKKYKTIKFK